MSTSGTVDSTVIDTAKVIDHAVRRCGLTPSTLTPEDLDTALDNLFLILTSLSNRGINLWCIDTQLVGLQEHKSTYLLQSGTLDVLSVTYRTGEALAHTATQAVDMYTAVFSSAVAVKTIGMYFNQTKKHSWLIEASVDGTTWATVDNLGTVQAFAGSWLWHDIDPAFATSHLRIRDTEPVVGVSPSLGVDTFRLMAGASEIPLSAMSRDTYNSIPNKRTPGRPVQYYFNKQMTQELTLWPEPADPFAHLLVRRHRQVQDVGTMQNTLEIPTRWFEAVVWELAKNLSFELQGVEKERRIEIAAFAATVLQEAEDGETDGAPFYLQPKISGYTR